MIRSALVVPPNPMPPQCGEAGLWSSLSRACESLTEGLIYFLVVFTPWALGTTENWSMVVADSAAYLLGLLLTVKYVGRWRTARNNGRPAEATVEAPITRPLVLRVSRWLTRTVALLTLGMLIYVLTSALNGRAAYDWDTNTFTYFSCWSWLPHSYDIKSTWPAFWNYLAWAAFFWSVHDWLKRAGQTGETGTHLPTVGGNDCAAGATIRKTGPMREGARLLPDRLQRLLWVLSINGGLLALEALLQQTTGTDRLLWLRETCYNRTAEAQFGPYPYRANGAQYLNLVWPVTLGFWWFLQRATAASHRQARHHLLLVSLLIMVVGPLISLSRGGALITLVTIGLCAVMLLMAGLRNSSVAGRWTTLFVLVGAIAGGLAIAGPKLASRMKEIGASYSQRERMSEIGRHMAEDNPVFGTGAETLQPLYQFYKFSPDEYWPGQLHNDWLETRVTFGFVGFGMILVALAATVLRWFVGGDGVRISWRLVSFFWIAMAGCLVHARWDLPFQVYSIVLLFLLYAAVLLRLVRKKPGA